ncbi:histidine kinase [Streptomyces sp. NPDC005438]|uniref:sensor histidine kinase n=1 Tax=Streptomyces sp. NPDC005438 TaxID=3156880 RepID=UPI0033B4A12C
MNKPARPHPHDLLTALGGLLVGLLSMRFGLYSTGEPPEGDRQWLTLALLVSMAGCEVVRRTLPRAGLLVGTVVLLADMVNGPLLVTMLMYTDVIYAAVLYGPRRLTRTVPVTATIGSVVVTVGFGLRYHNALVILVGLVAVMLSVVPALTGAIVRNHQDRAEAERLRAEQTALLAEMDRRQAVVTERARMARELHDLVANHLSAIALHSTAALSLKDDNPDAATDALGVIRENSVRGLAEMRRLIGILRDASDPEAEPDAAPTLDGLPALLRHAREHAEAGRLAFELRDGRNGESLPTPVELAAYRIIQESLTNALKHASPGTVTLALTPEDDALRVRVTSPHGDRAEPRAPGSGSGLVGMRERAELLGGDFAYGPRTTEDGQPVWDVHATLPLGERTST